jgi:transcription elongation factor Elf1
MMIKPEEIILVDPVRDRIIIREKIREEPKTYIFVCDKCGREEERICLNSPAALASYAACKKCAACAAITPP